MKNMSKKMIAASVAAMLLATSVTSVSFADYAEGDDVQMEQNHNKEMKGMKGAGMFMKKIEELLTDSEKEELQALMSEHKKAKMDEGEDDSDEDYEAMREAHHEEMRKVLANNAEAFALFEEHVAKMSEMGTKMKENKGERDDKIEGNRSEMKEKKGEYKSEKKDHIEELKEYTTEEEQEALKIIREEHKAGIAALKVKKQDWDNLNDEEKEAVKAEYEELKQTHYNDVKEALAGNEEALAELEEMKEDHMEMKGEHKNMKGENKKAREDFREKRGKIVDKHKATFIARLGNKLDNISDTKLEKVLVKIDSVTEKYENNESMSEERKDKVLSQIQALREIIEDRLETEIDEEINLDDILDV